MAVVRQRFCLAQNESGAFCFVIRLVKSKRRPHCTRRHAFSSCAKTQGSEKGSIPSCKLCLSGFKTTFFLICRWRNAFLFLLRVVLWSVQSEVSFERFSIEEIRFLFVLVSHKIAGLFVS